MKVYDIQTEHSGGAALVSARVEPNCAAAMNVWFRLDGIDHAPTSAAEALVVGMLAPCMLDGEHLKIYGALSWTLARNLEVAEDVLTAWYPHLTPVDVMASQFTRVWPGVRPAAGQACCFTAGVNSWYSLLKHERRITHLVLVRGFDPALESNDAWQKKRKTIGRIANRLGKRLVTCETNLRRVADKQSCGWGRAWDGDFWGEYLHGSALAAVGILLQREVGEIIVPAVHTFHRMKAWGSSPLLDPFWSTDRMRILHDGCELSRADKIRLLAASEVALEALHVCEQEPTNCGRCDKCFRTQLALHMAGALETARTFPSHFLLPAARGMLDPPRSAENAAHSIAVPHAEAVARYAARILPPRASRVPNSVEFMVRQQDHAPD